MTAPWAGTITRAHECDYAFQKKNVHGAMDFFVYY
jgi:hypothetical protein